jgi:hypothetical protein
VQYPKRTPTWEAHSFFLRSPYFRSIDWRYLRTLSLSKNMTPPFKTLQKKCFELQMNQGFRNRSGLPIATNFPSNIVEKAALDDENTNDQADASIPAFILFGPFFSKKMLSSMSIYDNMCHANF